MAEFFQRLYMAFVRAPLEEAAGKNEDEGNGQEITENSNNQS